MLLSPVDLKDWDFVSYSQPLSNESSYSCAFFFQNCVNNSNHPLPLLLYSKPWYHVHHETGSSVKGTRFVHFFFSLKPEQTSYFIDMWCSAGKRLYKVVFNISSARSHSNGGQWFSKSMNACNCLHGAYKLMCFDNR